jgi:hypothetical protein
VLYVTAAKRRTSILDSVNIQFSGEIMGRTLHQRVPLKSRSTISDLGMIAGVSALLLAFVLAYALL